MRKFSLINGEPCDGNPQQASGDAVQLQRLSERTPYGVMRQSELAGNELREGKSKHFPRSLNDLVTVELLDLAVKMFAFEVFGLSGFLPRGRNSVHELAKNGYLQSFFGWQGTIFENIKNAKNFGLSGHTPDANGIRFSMEAIVVLIGQHATKFAVNVYQHVSIIVADTNLDSRHESDRAFVGVNAPRGYAEIAFAPKESAKFRTPNWV